MRPYTLRRVVGMVAFIATIAGCSDDLGSRGSADQGVAAAASRATTPPPPAYTPEPDEPRHTTR
jgi:hypothetical protein